MSPNFGREESALAQAMMCSTLEDGDVAQNHPDSEELAESCGRTCADSWTCSICLDPIQFENLAVVKGCEHTYCAHCILKWTCTKETESLCPTCKAPFTSLLVHRQLDGSLTDFEVEESVVLLARASWFQDWLKTHERNKDLYKYPAFRSPAAVAGTDGTAPDVLLAREEWAEDALYQYFEDEYEDDTVEEYYFSSRAGPSRVTLGNRRWGANGFVRSGHRCARPVDSSAPRVSKGAGGLGAKAAAGSSSVRKGVGPSGGGGCGAGDGSSTVSKSQGRRARRNARHRAEADVPGM